jgi:signal transduction histidine kinase
MSMPRTVHGSAGSEPPSAAGIPLRTLIQEVVGLTATTLPAHTAADAPLIVVDVDRGHVIDAEPATVRRVLDLLIRDAVAAAAGPAAESDVPLIREVVITSVRGPRNVEVEIADSGAASADTLGMATAAARSLVQRLGGDLRVDHCPEGGRAVTLSFPRRESAQQTEGAGLRRAA